MSNDPKPVGQMIAGIRMPDVPGAQGPPPPVGEVDAELLGDLYQHRREAAAERWAARIPRRFVAACLDDLDDGVAQVVCDWLSSEGNLVITGPVGTGKTHTAVAAARIKHDDGKTILFRPVVELLDELRPGSDGNLSDATLVDVLVLDDLGAERPTDWTAERLYALINRRWLEQRQTIVTANLTPDELRKAIGERLYSRLVHGAYATAVGGPDRRRSE